MIPNKEVCTFCGEEWNASVQSRKPYVCPVCARKFRGRSGQGGKYAHCFTRGVPGRREKVWEA